MGNIKHRLEERSHLLPKRLESTLCILVVLAKDGSKTLPQLVEETGLSRGYILATCLGLKRYGILDSKRGTTGGYWLVKSAEETTVGDVFEAISRTDHQGRLTKFVYNFIVGKTKELTIAELSLAP